MSQTSIPDRRPRWPRQPLVPVLAAACAGVAIDRAWAIGALWSWSLALGAWLAWAALWRAGRLRSAGVLLLASVAAAGAAWHHCRWSLFESDQIGLFASDTAEPAALEARVVHGPRRIPPPPFDPLRTVGTPARTRLEVEAIAVRDQDRWRPAEGPLVCLVDGDVLGLKAGDRVQIFGQLATVRKPLNPGEVDFSEFARADRQLCSLRSEFPECVTPLDGRSGWSVSRLVDFLHAAGDRMLFDSLGPRRWGLASAMFLGSREELDPDQSQAFLQTGVIHLLVVSGLNVGILASCLFLAARVGLIPRAWTLALVAVATVLYAATTGAQPPVVRSTVMVLLACTAMLLGRRALGFNTIAAAGLVVLAINPAELFQAGTQLSFLSVAVLAWLADRRWRTRLPLDPLERLIARTRPWWQRAGRRVGVASWRAVLASLVIWIVICPLVMSRFHLLSPVAVVLGPILSIPVVLAMASGFGIFAAGWLWPALAHLLGWICDANLRFAQSSVEIAQRWRGGHYWVAGPTEWWLAGFYALLAWWTLAPRAAPPRRWCAALLLAWTGLGLGNAWLAKRGEHPLDVAFLSVGHGTAVVVELPGGQTLLYDAGSLGSPAAAARAVSGYLWSRGITHLDAIVLSHADTDHYNAVPQILERFSVGVVYVSPVMFERQTRSLAALRGAIEAAGVPIRAVWSGDRLSAAGSTELEVLHPPRQGVLGSDNANSIVLSIADHEHRILLAGDLESPGLDDVMAELPLDCDVVLAPHHGSAYSDPPGFAQWSTPEWAIVSGGARDRLESVRTAYDQRGTRMLYTADSGAVRVSIRPQKIHVRTFRQDGG